MKKSTTIVNYMSSDRIANIDILDNEYIAFTSMNRSIIVIDMTVRDKPKLLCNRTYPNRDALMSDFDNIILLSSKVITNDEFVSNLDTYIELNDVNNNTINEINNLYKIIVEDYNL